MVDFTVPLDPGWTERALAQSGPEDGDIAALSPALRRAMAEASSEAPLSEFLTLLEETDAVDGHRASESIPVLSPPADETDGVGRAGHEKAMAG